jgi:mono/diheme cytochrome c family protein
MNALKSSVLVMLAAAAVGPVRAQQAAARSAKDGVYTAVQAAQGKRVYEQHCLECHGAMTSATPDMAPLLNDHVFQAAWKARSLAELVDKVRLTMPPNKTGALSPQQLVDLVAYVLSANGLPSGEVALTDDIETLKQIRLDVGPP